MNEREPVETILEEFRDGDLDLSEATDGLLVWRDNSIHGPLPQREPGEEVECSWCEDAFCHFEVAELPSEVAHTFIGNPHGFCLTCHNHSAHPWHQEPPSLESIKKIEKYLDTMGFGLVRKDAATQHEPGEGASS